MGGLDEDGDGLIDCADPDCWDEAHCCDDDQDGFIDIACGGTDCNDRLYHVGDMDGDGTPDACDPCPSHAFETDADGDGDWSCTDCDDSDPRKTTFDHDRDGWSSCDGDCDDFNPAVRPGAGEVPDGIDNDCDGTVDEGTIHYDDDGDGYTEVGGDCDDTDPNVSPAHGNCP